MITYVGFRVIEGIIARLPRRLAYALGVVISTLAFPLLGRQRKALERNLEHVCPELAGPAIRKLAWQNWLNYTKAWIDFFKIPRMDRVRLGTLLTPIGRQFPFFGRLASFPTGPVELALKTGAPILPAVCLRDPDDRYIAIGEPPIFLTPSDNHDNDVRSAMQQILATFERYISRYPDQWHVLEPIWPDKRISPSVTIPSPPAQAAVGE